jgi:outer membrane protein assembly factor BamB
MKPFGLRTWITVLAGLGVLFVWPRAGVAGDWPRWRGPTGAGLTDESNLPLTWMWDGKKNENVLWYVDIGGQAHGSPIVWHDRVFVTTWVPPKDNKQPSNPELYVICYRTEDGKELWRTRVPTGAWPKEILGSNPSIPTPVTDGQHIYAWFGATKYAVLVALDMDGKVVWHYERPGPFELYPGLCSSPVLYQDSVLQLCDEGSGKGFLLALDKHTGAVRWVQKRKAESYNNSTPVFVPVKGRTEMVVSASNALQGLDPASGELIWSCKAPKGFGTISPAYGNGLFYTESSGPATGVCVDPTGQGDVSKSHVKWQVKAPGSYASPIIAGGYVYRASQKDLLTCWELATGKEVFTERLKGISNLASPFATPDGRVYFASGGMTYVIKAGPKLEVLAANSLENLCGDGGPSAAVANGRIYLKSASRMVCVGKK